MARDHKRWPLPNRADALPGRGAAADRKAVRLWLYGIALLIVVMVLVGGATRLTDSGLSITDWKPIHGIIPPLNDAEWQEEFAKYQQIPEYRLLNQGMSLGEFKGIFWWEWTHRLLGRLIGVAFLLPLLFFWATGRIERSLLPKLAGIFVLGGLQGAVGWWMVASGLSERTDVSQYRLAVHLTLAFTILAYVLWVARGLGAGFRYAPREVRGVAAVIVGLVLLQTFLGGLVAGLDAGLAFNTWPLMDGELLPAGLLAMEPPWRNLFENPLTVQFDHRLLGYVLFAVAWVHAFQTRGSAQFGPALVLAVMVTAQAGLGVATLVMGVPMALALLHQLGAVAVLASAVLHRGAMRGAAAPAPVAVG